MAAKSKRVEFYISGFDCATCTKIVGKALEGLPGLKQINISYILNRGYIDFDPEQLDEDKIEDRLRRKTRLTIVRRRR